MEFKGNSLKIFTLLVISVGYALAEEWSYKDVKSWKEHYPNCGGKRQSPINLVPSKKSRISNLKLETTNYQNFLSGPVKLKNNGHTIVIESNSTGKLFPGALLEYTTPNGRSLQFEPSSVHFHWGAPGKPGSEHKINSKEFAAEIHIVHANTNDSVETEYGLAVLGIMLKRVDRPKGNSPALRQIFSKLAELTKFDSVAYIKSGLNLSKLLSNVNPRKYYNYQGSLTTPPCSESVSWFVFPNALEITKAELRKFFGVRDSNGHKLISNFRPVQPLGNRTIYMSKELTNTG